MKRIISVIICAVIILTLTGCDSGDYKKAVEFFESGEYQQALEIFSDLEGYKDTDTYIEKINKKIKEEKYNDAISYIKSKDYVKAIELLEEIPDYNDSKDLVGRVHYVYASQLFNEKDFGGAYSHFQEATGFSDIDKRKSMVDYYGGIYLTNDGKYASACTYFKRAIDSDYVQDAVKHVSELTKNLLSGGWIGSCVVNGNTFQVQMTYSKSSNNFSLVWADRSNGGYKHVTDMDYGTLSVVGSRNAFYYEGNFYTVEFDFYSSTSVRAKWSDSKLDGMAGGMFKRDYAAVFEYKIPDVVYPTMTIPDLLSDSSDNSENNISNNINLLTEGNLVNKKLIVAVSPDYEPFEYEQNGDLVGFDIDLINLIANELGYYIEYKKCEFDAIIMCVAKGEADLGISAISINDTRLQSVDFTDVYVVETCEEEGEVYHASYAIAVPKGSELITDLNAQIKKLKDSGKIQELISKYNID